MTKSELIEALALKQTHLTQKDIDSAVKTLLEHMAQSLAGGERIEIRGFGSFIVREYNSYDGRNPNTGEIVQVKPKKLPFFKVGKELRESVNDRKVK